MRMCCEEANYIQSSFIQPTSYWSTNQQTKVGALCTIFLLATVGCQVTTHGVQHGMIFEEMAHAFVHTSHCDQFANESSRQ